MTGEELALPSFAYASARSAITSANAGEGKSTGTVGLSQALRRLGKKVVVATLAICPRVMGRLGR